MHPLIFWSYNVWLQRGNNETQGEVGREYGGGNATLNCIKTVQRMGCQHETMHLCLIRVRRIE